jgi:hypothetical protein
MANKNNSGAALPIGLGVAAAAAAAAGGAYWLYGAKHSAQHRKLAKSWMLKARAEVMEAVEKLEDIDKERYMQIVENVVKNYTSSGASAPEIAAMMKDFKAAWSHMQGKKTAKKAVKKAKGAVKKSAKKTAKRKGSR